MKRSLLVLLLAVLLPSLLLGWLALQSAREQQIVLERRTAELYQKETDNVATAARLLISEQRGSFAEVLRQLLAEEEASKLGPRFTTVLAERWAQPAVGFVLDRQGRLLCPTPQDAAKRAEATTFLRDNGAFLGNKTAETVYPVLMEELKRPDWAVRNRADNFRANNLGQAPATLVEKGVVSPQRRQQSLAYNSNSAQKAVLPAPKEKAEAASQAAPSAVAANEAEKQQLAEEAPSQRSVAPQQQLLYNTNTESQLMWATAEFRELTAEGPEGVVNRFVQDRLNMIFWVRPAEAREYIFGCLLRAEDLKPTWPAIFTPPATADAPEFVLALLDDKARPAVVHPAGSAVREWKKPFVASEIGEALPHWEATLYLLHPEKLAASAQRVRRNLYLLISCALGAIAAGGWVVMADTRRQLALAQKKTDFVSNVSHELKTPLTSIRMFAEMMHSGRAEPERQPQYLRIIMVEAERLTRLINNVLDFARLERKQRRFEKRPFDLRQMVSEVWPAQELHLCEAGFTTHWEAAAGSFPVVGDEDALAQVLVNLISNAEKYGGESKEVNLHTYLEGVWACVSVLDRGGGVPAGEEQKIFQPFYRAHDSLSSGIPGTGLGLALALRVVQEHQGEILYQARPGGGSNFTMRIPLTPSVEAIPEIHPVKSI